MAKIQKDNNDEKNTKMSNKMLHDLKSKIAKFGFEPREYEKFLESVDAMKDGSVIKYPNSKMDIYRDKHLKAHEYFLGDAFILDKVKIKSSHDDGKQFETGYFCPRSFWDKVLKERYDSTLDGEKTLPPSQSILLSDNFKVA